MRAPSTPMYYRIDNQPPFGEQTETNVICLFHQAEDLQKLCDELSAACDELEAIGLCRDCPRYSSIGFVLRTYMRNI